ncbi:MAG: hypothetical protein KDA52_03275 [Planctomycetaceae bacterium]|nr:hypothetical protein [Planctomycetaceae bacterium]
MIAKLFLMLIGLMYIALSVWCSVKPEATSTKVGLSRTVGQGESEFLVIYGGMELGLAIVFLLPWFKPDSLPTVLLACTILHGCLVAYRLASFAIYSEFTSMTYSLAAGEVLIFTTSLWLTWQNVRGSTSDGTLTSF